jgi:hypothetical protein
VPVVAAHDDVINFLVLVQQYSRLNPVGIIEIDFPCGDVFVGSKHHCAMVVWNGIDRIIGVFLSGSGYFQIDPQNKQQEGQS